MNIITITQLTALLALALEGLYVIAQLKQSKRDRQLEILIKIRQDFASEAALDDNYKLYNALPCKGDNPHAICDPPLKWTLQKGSTVPKYAIETSTGNKEVAVSIDDSTWRLINRVIERCQTAALYFRHGPYDRDDFLSWCHKPVLRFHSRLHGLIEGERTRRPSPKLWKDFDELADAAKKYDKQNS